MGQRCNRADRDRKRMEGRKRGGQKGKERKRIGGGRERDCKLESPCYKAGRKKRAEEEGGSGGADGVAMARLRVDTETCGGRRRRRRKGGEEAAVVWRRGERDDPVPSSSSYGTDC